MMFYIYLFTSQSALLISPIPEKSRGTMLLNNIPNLNQVHSIIDMNLNGRMNRFSCMSGQSLLSGEVEPNGMTGCEMGNLECFFHTLCLAKEAGLKALSRLTGFGAKTAPRPILHSTLHKSGCYGR